MKKLSIIIPVYNVEAYLARCLDSVLTVNSDDYEVIVVNDGSTDSSGQIAESYRERFPERITLISQENGGLGCARNTGLTRASGEFVYFLDSDDYLTPDGLSGILSTFSQPYDLCLFDSVSVDTSDRELGYIHGCDAADPGPLAAHPTLLHQIPNVWNKIIRRCLLTDHDIYFPDRLWFEDLYTMPKLYYYAQRVVYVPRAWHRYLQRSGSITNSARAGRNLEIITSVEEVLRFYKEKGLLAQLHDELEYMAYYHEFLTASVRVNLADRKSDVQEELMRAFLDQFPDYRRNAYIRSMPFKHRLLGWLLMHRLRMCVHAIMKANALAKGKKA